MAKRVMGMVKTVGFARDVAICGGVANNKGFKMMLEKEMDVEIMVPENVQTVAAIGIARIARKLLGK